MLVIWIFLLKKALPDNPPFFQKNLWHEGGVVDRDGAMVVDEDGGSDVRNVFDPKSLVTVEEPGVPHPVTGDVVSGLCKGCWVRPEGQGGVDEGLQDEVEVAGDGQEEEEEGTEKRQTTNCGFEKTFEKGVGHFLLFGFNIIIRRSMSHLDRENDNWRNVQLGSI